MKVALSSSLLLILLCAPALADAPATYVVELQTKTQRHTVFVADGACGEIQQKAPQRESYFRVCAQTTDSKYVRFEVERRTRENQDESRVSAVVLAAPSGASYDLLDAKMTVKTQ